MTAKVALSLLFGLSIVHPTSAQQSATEAKAASWLPYLGCWRPDDTSAPNADDVCVTTIPDGAVRITTSASGQPVLEQIIVADGVVRPVTEQDCRGTQRFVWSERGHHLLARTDLTCADQAPRILRALSTISFDSAWVTVESIEVGGIETVGVRTYRRIDTKRSSGPGFTIDDIIEATSSLSPRLVEAAIVWTGARFDLDSGDLLTLRRAGVTPEVIDAMVAVSFPTKFAVQAPGSYTRWSISESRSSSDVDADPFAWARAYAPFDLCAWRSWARQADFEYHSRSSGRVDVRRRTEHNVSVAPTSHYYASTPASDVAVERSSSPSTDTPAPAETTPSTPRVVNGQGYTRTSAAGDTAVERSTAPPGSSSKSDSSGTSEVTGSAKGTSASPSTSSKGSVTKKGYTRRPPND